MMGGRTAARSRIGLLLVPTLLVACGANEYVPPPPPSVTVALPSVEDVTLYLDYTGTTRAVETVDVRARVKGFLLDMYFEPGQQVEEGAPLFLIDPKPFEVALEAANAALASTQAEVALAKTEYERTRQMFKRDATSELDLVRKRAHYDKALAAVASAQSNVHAAQLDLDYAHVEAPITGRVGRNLVDMGNLVGAGEATLLTEMIQYAPLYVYFQISERDLLALQDDRREARAAAGDHPEKREPVVVEVGRANEAGYPHRGLVDFTALQVDPDTGTFEVRGVLPNAGEFDELIMPGTFVRVRVPIGNRADSLVVPENALGADQNGRYVLVVNNDDVVEHRSVDLGSRVGDQRVVLTGLRASDRVIVDGLQRARPGAKVAPSGAGATPAAKTAG